jgi:hypothetical protein
MGLAITTRPTQTHAAHTELVSAFGDRRGLRRIRFVLSKLHAKWLQFSVARYVFSGFLWAYFSAARPHIY